MIAATNREAHSDKRPAEPRPGRSRSRVSGWWLLCGLLAVGQLVAGALIGWDADNRAAGMLLVAIAVAELALAVLAGATASSSGQAARSLVVVATVSALFLAYAALAPSEPDAWVASDAVWIVIALLNLTAGSAIAVLVSGIVYRVRRDF